LYMLRGYRPVGFIDNADSSIVQITMKYGVCLIKTRLEKWVEAAQMAEELGFDSLWVGDHFIFPTERNSPFPGDETPAGDKSVVRNPTTAPLWDMVAVLCHLAAVTKTIRLGTCVYLLGLRHPIVAARAWQTLDVLSGGRADVGIGSGWLLEEWSTMGWDPKERGPRTDEALEVCKRLWSEEVVSNDGPYFPFGPITFDPKPVQKPWPRIHIGGESPPALRRLAKHGDGWLALEHTHSSFDVAHEKMLRAFDAVDRDPKSVEVSVLRHPRDLDDVQVWEERYGVERIILFPGSRATGGDTFKAMHEFAAEFMTES
jgi:probable F420-dependent oxidoreductase